MKYQIIGKNIKVTEGIKDKVERKLDLLEKYLIIKGDTDCRVVVSVETLVHKIEVTIPTKYAILRA
jgi:putative sigma-54 modulation protein